MSNRCFLLPLDRDEPVREFLAADWEGDGVALLDESNVVSVREGLPNGNVSVSLEGSYDTFEILVNQPVERAVALMRALLQADTDLPE
jgi:hypothetical protein